MGLDSITGAISDGWNAASKAVSDGASAVGNAASSATQAVSDFGSEALDRAKDLGQAGLDAGRRGIEAVRDFDVREAADTVRSGISTATEAARDGIATGVNWTGERIGEGAQWARDNVPGGDNIVSNAARGLITQAEQNTRFTVGVAGGVLREAASTVGAAGQLATTVAEMQASPEAAAEYGQGLLDGASNLATATADYVSSAAQDPSRIGRDIGNAYDGASDFVGGTLDRYGKALAEGRTEEIGMDVGAVATYVVPVGGGPARGLATAAVRDGAGALTRAAATDGAKALAGSTTRALADDAAVGAARLAEQRGAGLVERMAANGGTAPLEQGAGRVADIAAASRQSGREIAVYRDANGQRMITQGAEGSVSVPAGSRIVAHTQPGVGGTALTPSAADLKGLEALSQRSSHIIDDGGNIARFSREGSEGLTQRAGSERVTFEAPKVPRDVDKSFPDGGWIKYGKLDDLGRPTGVEAYITPDMIGTGSKASGSIHPPGWSGDGALYNESRGHLLGNQLGGSGSLKENLITLQQNPANSPVMRDFETAVRDAVESGEPVHYKSIPDYDGDNLVARGVTLTGKGDKSYDLGVTVLNPIATK